MAKKVKKTAVKKKPAQSSKEAASVKKTKTAAKKQAGKSGLNVKKRATKSIQKKAIQAKTNKKKAGRQTAPRSGLAKPSQTGKTYLSEKDLSHFRELLLNKLHEILGDVDWIENEALKKSRQDSAGDLSTMPIHMADLGTDNYEQEFSLGLMDSERKIVQEILDALKRIALGTYGICEGTGRPIRRARLEANPWARYCVEFASLIEQGKAMEDTNLKDINMPQDINKPEGAEDTEIQEEDDLILYNEEDEEDEEEGNGDNYTKGLYYEDENDIEEDELY